MECIGPHVRTLPVRCAPRKAPCPRCGELGNRKAIHHRRVRTIAYKQVVFLDVTYGEYRACCHCCTTFRTTLPGVEPRALYDNKVREAVLDRILEDGMSVERVIASMGRDFLLNLSDGFVYDCLDWQVRQLDLADHRRWVLDHFSGTLCVDELPPGPDDFAAGDRPAERPAGGLRPGRQQRPTPHAAVPQEPQDLGAFARGGGDRWDEPLPDDPGRVVAGRPPPSVRVSRPERPP